MAPKGPMMAPRWPQDGLKIAITMLSHIAMYSHTAMYSAIAMYSHIAILAIYGHV